jgi:hypothetical protein
MRHFKVFVTLYILLWAVAVSFGQNFSEAQMTENNTFPESFQFSAFDADYVVDAKSGKVQKTSGGAKKNFTIPLDKDDEIGRIYFSAYDDDLFLL